MCMYIHIYICVSVYIYTVPFWHHLQSLLCKKRERERRREARDKAGERPSTRARVHAWTREVRARVCEQARERTCVCAQCTSLNESSQCH